MELIFNFFAQIADFFSSIISFLHQQVQALFSFVKVFYHVVSALPVYTRFYSGQIVTWFLGVVALCVIFRILGREG